MAKAGQGSEKVAGHGREPRPAKAGQGGENGGIGAAVGSIFLPLAFLGGLFLLGRRNGGQGGMGIHKPKEELIFWFEHLDAKGRGKVAELRGMLDEAGLLAAPLVSAL